MTTPAADTETMEINLEIEIAGTPEAVWAALTDGIDAWWPAEFYTGGLEETRTFTLEARPGGRMYENWGGGAGTLWATIASVEPGVRLQATGTLFPNWGGPSLWFGSWELESQGEGTGGCNADKCGQMRTFADVCGRFVWNFP